MSETAPQQAEFFMNRLHNAGNMSQGDAKRVLAVCSAGLLRSPTAAVVLSQPPFGFNARAVGIVPQFALIAVDEILLHWSDEIVCMDPVQESALRVLLERFDIDRPVHCLDIPDTFPWMHPRLQGMIRTRCARIWGLTLSEE